LIDTPAAVVDLDRLERNLRRWQDYADEAGLRNRPHVKTHRCVEIARRQIELGAMGITCQKLGEAEVMVDAGIDDVLIPYNIVGESKLERLRALARRARVAVSVDSEELLAGLAGADVGVLVECDTGLGRAGVQTPDDAVALARAIAETDGLRFEGFLTYPALPRAEIFLAAAVFGAQAAGLEVQTVSSGGTPTMWSARELAPLVTEYRVGNYAFYDRNSVAAGAATLDDVALTVHATVVSRPTRSRAVLDAGSKSLSSDHGPDDAFGQIVEAPASRIVRLNEEHAYVELGDGDELELGQRVRVVPNHACVVANLFDELNVGPDDVWRVDARGRSR
jgi:D-serine deaminase-like pyridoxal phosphate-dependent protein